MALFSAVIGLCQTVCRSILPNIVKFYQAFSGQRRRWKWQNLQNGRMKYIGRDTIFGKIPEGVAINLRICTKFGDYRANGSFFWRPPARRVHHDNTVLWSFASSSGKKSYSLQIYKVLGAGCSEARAFHRLSYDMIMNLRTNAPSDQRTLGLTVHNR